MKEGIERLPQLEFIPNVIQSSDLEKIPSNPTLNSRVLGLMTPPEIFAMGEFPNPEIITPEKYPNFDSILIERERIRKLELLPIKTPEEYARYHAQSKEELIIQVLNYFGDQSIALAFNLYPYWLPEDLEQSIVWIKNGEIPLEEIAEFIAKSAMLKRIPVEELIVFERPLNISTRIVRGSFPNLRHVHFWSKL